MQTSADHPLDLNDRGQGVDRRPPTSPEAYQERLDRFEASGVYEAHAAKFEAAKAKAAAERFRRGVRSAEGFPCPEPAFTPSHSEADLLDADDQASGDSGYRRGLIGGYMNGTSWDGFTAWGRAYQAGQEAGRFWRIRPAS